MCPSVLWLGLVAAIAGAGVSSQATFERALAIEGQSPAAAADLYRRIVAAEPESSYASEARFRLAVIEDERNQHPAVALQLYRAYLEHEPRGRMAMRAEARIAALVPYERVPQDLLHEYLSIVAEGNQPRAESDMKRFIDEHPDYPLLDDALFWLGNATKGTHSRGEQDTDRIAARASIPIYERILQEFPGTRNRLAVLKNLGDAHQTLGEYDKATRYYAEVSREGGEQGAALVHEPATGAKVRLWQWRFLFVSLALLPLALVGLVRVVPYRKEYRRPALRNGLKVALRLLPFAVVAVAAAFLLSKPGEGGQTGAEPWLLTVCMVALLVFSFANGVIMSIDERQPVSLGLYLPTLAVLTLTALYSALYGLHLLTPFDRMFG